MDKGMAISWPRMNSFAHTVRTSALKFSRAIAFGGPLSPVMSATASTRAARVMVKKSAGQRIVRPSSSVVATLGPQTALRPMERIRAINDWMKKYAAAEGHVYLDYFSAMLDQSGLLRSELSGDDLHPNAQGYAIMAPLAEAAIKQALK